MQNLQKLLTFTLHLVCNGYNVPIFLPEFILYVSFLHHVY